MRFDGQKHQRGIHCLTDQSDQQILARARVKGLALHPDASASIYEPAHENKPCRVKGAGRRGVTQEMPGI